MRKKILLFLLLFLLFSANVCLADEKTGKTEKIGLIEEIYGYIIKVGAGLALLALIWGGVKFLLASGDPNLITEAKAWLISGFTGLILIAAAGTLYKGIRGEFPSFEIKFPDELPEIKKAKQPGVFFCSTSNCPTISTEEGEEIPDPALCEGPYIYSVQNVHAQIKLKTKSIRVVDDIENKKKYGLILFGDPEYKGSIIGSNKLYNFQIQKHYPLTNNCIKYGLISDLGSVAILGYWDDTTGEKLGGRVDFHQFSLYGKEGGKGINTVQGAKIKSLTPFARELGVMAVEYKDTDLNITVRKKISKCTPKGSKKPCLYKKPYEEGYHCLDAITIIGNYAVLLENILDAGGAGKTTLTSELFFPRGPISLSSLQLWANKVPNYVTIYPYETK